MTIEQPIMASDESVFRSYERQRQLRLLQIITPLVAILENMFLIGFTAFTLVQWQLNAFSSLYVIEESVLVAASILYISSYLATRKEQVSLAAWLMIGTTTSAFVITCIAESYEAGFNAFIAVQFLGFAGAIILTGALGTEAQTIGVTLVSMLASLTSVLVGQTQQSPTNWQLSLISSIFSCLVEAALGGMIFAIQRTSQQTIGELGAIRAIYERARQLDELKDQFISSINHEIRNPVMAMLTHLDNLAHAPEAIPRERLIQYAQRAMVSGTSLRVLLDSILDARRIDESAHNFVPKRVEVRLTLLTALQLIDPVEGDLEHRELRITIPDDLAIWGDSVRLQQIFANLVSNALKYSPPHMPIEIAARAITTGGKQRGSKEEGVKNQVEVLVRDYGLGIPHDQAPLLFNRFVRLPRDIASTIIGNGVGLYLCRVLTEAMKGTIHVESLGIAGEGSTFVVRLPLAA